MHRHIAILIFERYPKLSVDIWLHAIVANNMVFLILHNLRCMPAESLDDLPFAHDRFIINFAKHSVLSD